GAQESECKRSVGRTRTDARCAESKRIARARLPACRAGQTAGPPSRGGAVGGNCTRGPDSVGCSLSQPLARLEALLLGKKTHPPWSARSLWNPSVATIVTKCSRLLNEGTRSANRPVAGLIEQQRVAVKGRKSSGVIYGFCKAKRGSFR